MRYLKPSEVVIEPDDRVPGSGLWSRLKPDELRRLRRAGRERLLQLGVPAWQLNSKEVDRYLESCAEKTLAAMIKSGRWV